MPDGRDQIIGQVAGQVHAVDFGAEGTGDGADI